MGFVCLNSMADELLQANCRVAGSISGCDNSIARKLRTVVQKKSGEKSEKVRSQGHLYGLLCFAL
jgi:hypothetical protein